MGTITVNQIKTMGYVDFMAALDEINRPPGGKDSLRILVQNSFLNQKSKVLHVACNTGSSTVEVARLGKCKAVGIDINPNMIKTANKMLKKYHSDLVKQVQFKVANGMILPFKDNTFDLVFSAGGTAFISDIFKALQEYKRVCKPWGFIGEMNLYYHTPPPEKIIKEMNDLMQINIKPWDLQYWLDLYKKTDLEMFYYYEGMMKPATEEKVTEYCTYLVQQKKWPEDVAEVALKRLINIMILFNENHKYLAYGVFIMRKRTFPEVILF